jgi:hypothetical protein
MCPELCPIDCARKRGALGRHNPSSSLSSGEGHNLLLRLVPDYAGPWHATSLLTIQCPHLSWTVAFASCLAWFW